MEAKAYQAGFKDKDYDLAWGGWGADYPDPQNWMTGNFACASSNNKYNFCDKAFHLKDVNADSGGCAPAALKHRVEGDRVLLTENDILAGWRLFH